MHLKENIVLTFDLGVKGSEDVTQNPLRHVTYADQQFEVVTSNGLGTDTFR